VTLPDGQTVPAKLKGRDSATDLALLACETASASSATFTSSPPRPGQIVLTVGRTLDTGPIATMGIVSGVSSEWRTWRGGKLDEFVRLDVSVYPTSTGGAVVGADGTILGIVAGGLSRSSVIAITRPTIDRVAESLSVKGRIARGYIGVAVQPVAIPHSLNAGQETAVMALHVEEAGPAGRAGMVMGDVLLSLGGHDITGPDVLHGVLDPDSPGKQFDARILRAGVVQQISIAIEERPARNK
jgi:S1-C subfamily serine protease